VTSDSTDESTPSSDAPNGPSHDNQGALAHGELRRRARMGVVLLILRTVAQQLITLCGTVVLARVLDPADFGVYAIAQFAMSFFAMFGDAGLGAALIQKREAPTQRELSGVFYLQIGFALIVMLVVGFGAGSVRLIWTDLPPGSEWLFRALSLGLLLTVLRVIPTILMERQLQFGRLATIEVTHSIAYYLVAVPLALAGFRVWALAAGALGQGIIALIVSLVARPWRPVLSFAPRMLRPILRFGLAFQVKLFVGFLSAAVSPVYAGMILGARPVGFINWAQTTAYFPLKLVEIVGRVTFPLYSRMNHDSKALADTLGRSLQVCSFGAFFFAAMFVGMGRQLIEVVFTAKWIPALPLLQIYSLALCIGFVTPVVASAFDALGKPHIIARLTIGWTILNWIVVLFTTPRWGIVGFVGGYCVHMIVGNIAVLYVMTRVLPGTHLARRLWAPGLAGLAAWGVARLLGGWVHGPLSLVAAVGACLAAFAVTMVILDLHGLLEAMELVPRMPAGAATSPEPDQK
jgi:teichuronic acid exporter